MGDWYIGAYWGPRKESAHMCAERLASCLNDLAAVSKVFAAWYEKGKSRRNALRRTVEPTQDALVDVLNAERNRRDLSKAVIDELGFRVGLWNGASEEQAASLSISCGMYAQNEYLWNAVVLNFPERLGDLGKKEPALKALLAIVRAWEPEWAGVMSHSSIETRLFTPGSPFVDWMIYLRRDDINRSRVPPSASVVNVDDLGTIIITQDVPVDANNQEHVQNIQVVEAAISA